MAGDVCLVVLPYGAIERPSLGASIVKAALVRAGVPCRLMYTTFRFAERLGTDVYNGLSWVRRDMMGEWTFSGAAFPEAPADPAPYFERLARHLPDPAQAPAVARQLLQARAAAEAFIEEIAREVVATAPAIVACTSTLSQHCASLALLRRVKALAPGVVTLLGGANCEGASGLATLVSFPWVDFVVSGEGDEIAPVLCRQVLARGGADVLAQDLPFGVLGAPHRAAGLSGLQPVPRAVCADLDASPIPDFDDYFEGLSGCAERAHIHPGLPLETSRGCWWGQRRPCAFCGLNARELGYRTKSPGRVLEEIRYLRARHGVDRVLLVDTLVSPACFETVFPSLAQEERPPSFFAEIRATVTEAQMRLLRDAGAVWVQPGLESLDDALLDHMHKGTRAWMNVRVLKWARELGLAVSWNLLAGFPGEDDAWFGRTADLLPALEHLQPPTTGPHRIRYERFSPIVADAARLGLRLRPVWSSRCVYPTLSEEALESLIYEFESDEEGEGAPPDGPGYQRLAVAADAWRRSFRRSLPPLLCAVERPDRTIVFDTRGCATEARLELEGLAHRVHRALADPLPWNRLVAAVRPEGETAPESEAAIREALDDLVQRRLVLPLGNRWMALALRGDVPSLPRDVEDGYPGGWVVRRARRQIPGPSRAATGGEPLVVPRLERFDEPLPLDCGRVLPRFEIAFETWGRLSPARDNAVLVCHPLTADAHAAGRHGHADERPGWWDAAIGPGRMLDTRRWFVICSNALGGWGGSTGPSSRDEASGRPWGGDFPVITVSDIVRAQGRLVARLGLERLRAVVGGCFGGQQALLWAIEHPEQVAAAVVVGTTAATSAHTIATFSVMRKLIREDAHWRGGHYYGHAFPSRGLSSALAVAVPLWMSREALERRFGRRRLEGANPRFTLEPEFEVEAYLERVSTAPRVPVDPNGLMTLMRAEEYFDLERQFGGLEEAFRPVRARVLLVSHRGDWRYPPREVQRLQDALVAVGADARHEVCDSALGHAAIRYDVASFAPAVRAFLEGS